MDKKSKVPLYHQLLEIFNSNIDEGVWCVGDRLPTENQLSKEYGVSKITVRQALGILENEGRVDRQAGRGTFVAQPLLEYAVSSTRYSFEMQNISNELLEISSIVPTTGISSVLCGGRNVPVTRVRQLIYSNNVPAIIQSIFIPNNWVDSASVRDIKDANETIKKIISCATTVKETYEPVSINEYESGLLRKKNGSPAIMIEAHIYIDNNVVLVEKSVIAHGKLTTTKTISGSQAELEHMSSVWL